MVQEEPSGKVTFSQGLEWDENEMEGFLGEGILLAKEDHSERQGCVPMASACMYGVWRNCRRGGRKRMWGQYLK